MYSSFTKGKFHLSTKFELSNFYLNIFLSKILVFEFIKENQSQKKTFKF